MRRNPIPILSTRKLSDDVMTHLSQLRFDVEAFDFITTQSIDSSAIKQEVRDAKRRPQVAIFTSKIAVESVAMMNADIKPQWKIYCIGQSTKEIAAKHFGRDNITHTASNSLALAQLVVRHAQGEQVTFFCGDRRRDDLPDTLKSHDIPVKEIVVYSTHLTPHLVTNPYAGILFYSPSTVQSFFTNNSLSESAVLFAIGHTTSAEIRHHCSHQIVISDLPSKEHLIRTMISHFSSI